MCVCVYIYIYITRLASNEIFSPSNKIHREVGRAKDLSEHKAIMVINIKQNICYILTHVLPIQSPDSVKFTVWCHRCSSLVTVSERKSNSSLQMSLKSATAILLGVASRSR